MFRALRSLLCTILLFTCTLGTLGTRAIKFKRVNHFIPSDALYTIQTRDLTECCSLCSLENVCKFVSYNKLNKNCDFHAPQFWTPSGTPSNYVLYHAGDSYFELVKIPMTRQDAKLSCESKGGHLVNIQTEAKHVEIISLLQKTSISVSDYAYAYPWTGGQYMSYDGNFYWTDGSAVADGYTGWASTQPDNSYGNEHCIHLQLGQFDWNDVDCGRNYWSICEYQF